MQTFTSPSGRSYTWEKDTAPTKADIDAMVEHDKASGPAQPSQPAAQSPSSDPYAPNAPYQNNPMRPTMGASAGMLAGQQRGQAPAGSGPIADIAMRGGGPAVGQALGAATGPFAPVAVPVLGAIGGAGGDALAQFRGMRAGEQPGGFRMGQMLGAGAMGAIPGGSLAKMGAGSLARSAALQGAGNLGAKAIETGVDEGRMPTGSEAAMAAGLGAAGPLVGKALDRGLNKPTMSAAMKAAQDAEFVSTLKSGQEAGYVIPPSFVKGGFLNNTAESFAGKAATIQQAVQQNQPVTNRLAREWLGLPADAALSPKTIATARVGPNSVYAKVAGLNDEAAIMLEQYKQAKSQSRYKWDQYQSQMSGERLNPTVQKEAQAADVEAADLFNQLKKEAAKSGKSGLIDELKAAEVKLAKLGIAEKGIEGGNGRDISASAFSNPEGRGITDEGAKIGQFYDAFDRALRDAASSPAPGVNKLSALFSMGAGAAGAARFGPAGAAFGALPFMAEGPARGALLSKYYQKNFVNPSYGQTRPDMDALLAKFATQNAGR